MSHYLLKNNSAVWRCFPDSWPHTQRSNWLCPTHPLITGEDYYKIVNWTVQTRHTVVIWTQGDMDNYFVICWWSKLLYTANTATYAFHKVERRHYSGKVAYSILIWNLLRILSTINYRNLFVFRWAIKTIKGEAYFRDTVYIDFYPNGSTKR